jgi:MFS family permease
MFTYVTTTTIPSFFELQDHYAATFAEINWTLAVPALGLSLGPLIWSSFADIYGRRLIFILGSVVSLAATVGAAMAPTYDGYMAARFFQGFGVSPAATVGLAVINDMYFDYQRGQKIGLWVLAIDTGVFVGPIFGGFLDLVSLQWIQWFSAIIFATLLLLELAFMPETLFPRNHMLAQMPMVGSDDDSNTADLEKVGRKRSDATEVALRRTKNLPFLNVKPVPGMRHPKPWDSLTRFFQTFKFPVVVIALFGYCFMWYWFLLSVIIFEPVAYMQYSVQIQGLLFIGLLLGTVFAEIFCSGALSDLISKRMAKKRGHSIRLPEDRLWLTYPAAAMSAVGLILWGISVDKMYHWMVGQVAFFIFAAGIQIGNTCICAYIVDAYPLQSMSIITFYSVWLNMSAFLSPVSCSCYCNGATLTNTTWDSSSLHHGKQHLDLHGASRYRVSSPFSALFPLCSFCRSGALRCAQRVGNQAGSIPNSILSEFLLVEA